MTSSLLPDPTMVDRPDRMRRLLRKIGLRSGLETLTIHGLRMRKPQVWWAYRAPWEVIATDMAAVFGDFQAACIRAKEEVDEKPKRTGVAD